MARSVILNLLNRHQANTNVIPEIMNGDAKKKSCAHLIAVSSIAHYPRHSWDRSGILSKLLHSSGNSEQNPRTRIVSERTSTTTHRAPLVHYTGWGNAESSRVCRMLRRLILNQENGCRTVFVGRVSFFEPGLENALRSTVKWVCPMHVMFPIANRVGCRQSSFSLAIWPLWKSSQVPACWPVDAAIMHGRRVLHFGASRL